MALFLAYAFVATLICYAIMISINAWYIKTYIHRYYYDCNDQFVTIKKGVFAPTEIHVQYQKIQDVYVDQDLLDRFMGIYDVHIASATVTSGIEAHIDGVDQPVAESIKNFMLAKIQGGNIPAAGLQNPQGPQTPLPPQAPRPAPRFESAQNISSRTYPISGAWMFSATVGAAFYALISQRY
jgi:putative membrane protein